MIGTTVSHYNILEKLGEGGMGVVYKARDTKLDRTVALKFLPRQLTITNEDKQRFFREAKSAATLNHQNICTIYDIQEHRDAENERDHLFIVMEYVEGHSLRDKMSTITFKQAIEFGVQIADGLAVAHEHGIIHRDIKPENVMIRKDGRVLIMDFGLAKGKGLGPSITKEGSTVGTAAYMSPEQVQGLDTDHRSDIFSLGIVLYEMFVRRMPFQGVHETALAYEIVNVEPEPLSSINTDIEPVIDTIVLDCLEKDPKERCQSAAEVSRNLRRFKRSSGTHTISGAHPRGTPASIPEQPLQPVRKLLLSPAVVSAFGILFIILVALQFFRSGEETGRNVIKAYIPPESGTRFHYIGPNAGPVAVSPDGSILTYTATNAEGNNILWVRSLGAAQARELRGTEGAKAPFWSADNRRIGFFADGKLKIVGATGGLPEIVTDVWVGFGGSWSDDGTILYSAGPLNPINRISLSGGDPVAVTNIDESRGEHGHRWPQFLPDGKHFLYLIQGEDPAHDGVFVGSIESDLKKPLLRNLSQAIYASGHILFVREGILFAQPFDTRRLEFTGDPEPVEESVMEFSTALSYAAFSASQNGILAYHSGEYVGGAHINIVDRSGTIRKTLGESRPYHWPRYSPDESKIAVSILDPPRRTNDLWWIDVERNVSNRLTFSDRFHYYPVWSPDGNDIAHIEVRENSNALVFRSLFSEGDVRTVYETELSLVPNSWSPDGSHIMAHKTGGRESASDLWVVPLDERSEPFPLFQTQFNEVFPAFSPDGRWIAYQSDETGRPEIYIRPFPGPGRRWQVSTGGGERPVWTKNGNEILFLDRLGNIAAVPIVLRDDNVTVGRSTALFTPVGMVDFGQFDSSADGEMIIYPTLPTMGERDYITLVINWDAGIR
jgi:eukaryotic-like serine/threonine-protein kinase